MTTEELNTVLYQKMYEEQERFKEELRNASPQEIMLNAYELVIREDILLHLEENDLSPAQAKALLKSDLAVSIHGSSSRKTTRLLLTGSL